MACGECGPFLEKKSAAAGDFRAVWRVVREWQDHPESGLYVECADLECRACGQKAYMDDNAWSGATFEAR